MEYESHYFAEAILMILLLSLTPEFLYGADVIDNKGHPSRGKGRSQALITLRPVMTG